ncbi:hypothetical protein M3Y99_01738600 [Aphelenchoides fujianensis]|nr:hypothetical protein M3Y99_01738600 [Aphelenchoides fujianensis]
MIAYPDHPFSIAEFPTERHTVEEYASTLECAFTILDCLVARIEHQLKAAELPEDAEEELRSLRGKVIVLARNNLNKFRSLVQDAVDDEQGIQDLTGFWSLVCSEMADLQRSVAKVEKHRLNGWQSGSEIDE